MFSSVRFMNSICQKEVIQTIDDVAIQSTVQPRSAKHKHEYTKSVAIIITTAMLYSFCYFNCCGY